jgi:hypothetical protein
MRKENMTPEEIKKLVKEAVQEIFTSRDEEARAKRPLTYKIYKGMGGKQGCFQFSLSSAYSGKRKDEGAVFIEAAPTIGPNKYDWDNKVIFALSASDIGAVLTGFRQGKFDIYHDPDAQTDRKGTRGKRLSLESGKTPGTFFLRLSEKAGEDTKQTNISLQPNEARILLNLLEEALPKVLGWR